MSRLERASVRALFKAFGGNASRVIGVHWALWWDLVGNGDVRTGRRLVEAKKLRSGNRLTAKPRLEHECGLVKRSMLQMILKLPHNAWRFRCFYLRILGSGQR